MRIRWYWLAVFLFSGLATFFIYQQLQTPLTYGLASDFDGNDYHHAYDYFIDAEPEYHVPAPFHQRVLVPFLASLMDSGNIINDFSNINLAFILLSVLLLFILWRELSFNIHLFIFGFAFLFLHWTGMVRLNVFDPITVDLPLYAFQVLFLILLLKRKFYHLLWLAPLATIQKESFIGLMTVLLVYAWWHNRKTEEGYFDIPVILAALILSVVAQSVVTFNFPPEEEGKNALITIAYHAKEAIVNPFEIVRWLAAMAMAFGPMIWLSILHYKKTFRYDNRRNLLVLFTGVYLAYGILAGGDMTRIIFLGFPFIMTWMLYEAKEAKCKYIYTLLLLSLPLFMLHNQIPDPAFERESWESWYPEFAAIPIVIIILGYSLFTGILIRKTIDQD